MMLLLGLSGGTAHAEDPVKPEETTVGFGGVVGGGAAAVGRVRWKSAVAVELRLGASVASSDNTQLFVGGTIDQEIIYLGGQTAIGLRLPLAKARRTDVLVVPDVRLGMSRSRTITTSAGPLAPNPPESTSVRRDLSAGIALAAEQWLTPRFSLGGALRIPVVTLSRLTIDEQEPMGSASYGASMQPEIGLTWYR